MSLPVKIDSSKFSICQSYRILCDIINDTERLGVTLDKYEDKDKKERRVKTLKEWLKKYNLDIVAESLKFDGVRLKTTIAVGDISITSKK